MHFIVAMYKLRIACSVGPMTAAQKADEARRSSRAEELALGMRVEDSEDEDERQAALCTFSSLCPHNVVHNVPLRLLEHQKHRKEPSHRLTVIQIGMVALLEHNGWVPYFPRYSVLSSLYGCVRADWLQQRGITVTCS